MAKNIRIEGPFTGTGGRFPEHLNKCGSCGEEMGTRGGKEDKEYRKTWDEELFKKTGGREGRIYYCVPCGEEMNIQEGIKANEEQKKINERRIKGVQETIRDCSSIISSLTQRLAQENVVGTIEDYKKIKSVQQRLKKLGNFEDPNIKGDIENLKKNCLDLINEYISPKDRRTIDSKYIIHSPCCTPRNVKLEENGSEQYYYCDYCWETESPKFLQSLKSYCLGKLNKKMLDNGISSFELNSSNYQSMLTVPDFLLTQEGIKNTYQKAEKDLEELLKKKGINIQQQNVGTNNSINNKNKDNNIITIQREREREREQIRQYFLKNNIQSITLSNNKLLIKYNHKTEEEEPKTTELQQIKDYLQKQPTKTLTLKDLEKNKKSNSSNSSVDNRDKDGKVALIVGCGVVGILVILIAFIFIRRNKNKKY